jgi:pSer/pThr/pTyr-binding forkhead associated (FHA) protein
MDDLVSPAMLEPCAITIYGRSPDCDVVVDDEYATNRHARVVETIGGAVWLEDLGSTNGTWCRGMRVYRMPIVRGTKFRIGRTDVSWPPTG